jgi:hypothetical protein
MKTKNKISGNLKFFIIVIIIYLIFLIFRKDLFLLSLDFFNNIIIKILPIFLLVFILMVLTNYFITPKFLLKHLSRKGIKKWFFIIISGILSTGPIYMWYPLLADLKNKGLSYGLIACFLYNRAIHITLFPIAIFYFGLKYVLVLTIVMIFISIFQGLIINRLMNKELDYKRNF